MTEAERKKNTPQWDDPIQWPDERAPLPAWQQHLHDIIVALAAAGWCLFIVGIGALSVGWISRIAYGVLVSSFVVVALAAFSNRRSS